MEGRANLEEIRSFYARLMAVASGSSDPRLERAFETVPREAFVPPGPWKIVYKSRYIETPSADPSYLYQDLLVALDAQKRINNGEPSLHAAWLGAVGPQRGDAVVHIGAGTGYYSAILSMLVLPNGQVTAYEIDESLANRARGNLEPFEAVTVVNRDATRGDLPPADVIYVNAGVSAPPAKWLRALNKGGRMIFPWRPSEQVALTLLVQAEGSGFSVKPGMQSWFIPCIGAGDEIVPVKVPASLAAARSIRSVCLVADRSPDDSAVAVYPDVWFSSDPVAAVH